MSRKSHADFHNCLPYNKLQLGRIFSVRELLTHNYADVGDGIRSRGFSLNFSPIEKTKAALRGIKVVSSNSYAKGEERPYGNRVYNRTNGISATGAAPSDREI